VRRRPDTPGCDALLEWREIAHELGERLERHQQEIEAQKAEVARISQCHVQCQVENAELRGEIKLLQSAVRRLQGLADDEAPATVVPATLVAGLDGTILQASPAITPLLHWMAREVIGKNAETLLPERYRQALRDELARTPRRPPGGRGGPRGPRGRPAARCRGRRRSC
jgi:PAS domain-containing protein